MGKRILVVDDEKLIVKGIRFSLEQDGMEVDTAYDGEEALQKIKDNEYDMILLDIMLPGDDGLTILKKLRDDPITENIPVIIISAKTTELDRVKGLDLGADDYLCKPFGVMELVSRVKARLRGKNQSNEYRFAEILLNEDTRKVFISGKHTELTYKEFELLKTLIGSPGKAFTRDYLIDTIWGQESTGRTLDVHIRTLRAKLGEYGSYIKTVRNVGYKLDKDE